MRDKIKIIRAKIKSLQIFEGLSKEEIILGVFIVLLAGFLLYQSLIVTQTKRIQSVGLQLKSQKRLLNFYNQLITSKDSFLGEIKERQKALEKIKVSFISEEGLSNYFGSLRELIKSYSLEVVTLEFKPQETVKELGSGQSGLFQKMSFDVSVKGGYFNIMSFIYKLEQQKPVYDIKSVKIAQESPQDTQAQANIQAAVYILINQPTATPK